MITRLFAIWQLRLLLTIVLCSGAFILFLFALNLGIIASIVLDAVLYIGLRLVFSQSDPSAAEAKLLLREAGEKLELLRGASAKVSNPRFRKDVKDINELSMQIMQLVQKKTADVYAAKQLLTYYLDNTLEITKRYASLSARSYLNDSSRSLLSKMEDVLTGIKDNFITHYNKLLQNDLSDVKLQMDAVSQMLEWEELK